jgi:hypothetical protein
VELDRPRVREVSIQLFGGNAEDGHE